MDDFLLTSLTVPLSRRSLAINAIGRREGRSPFGRYFPCFCSLVCGVDDVTSWSPMMALLMPTIRMIAIGVEIQQLIRLSHMKLVVSVRNYDMHQMRHRFLDCVNVQSKNRLWFSTALQHYENKANKTDLNVSFVDVSLVYLAHTVHHCIWMKSTLLRKLNLSCAEFLEPQLIMITH